MKFKEIPKKVAYHTTKRIAGIIAPLAAVASTAGKGGDGYLDNVAAIYHVPKQLYELGEAFVKNEGVRDFTFNRLEDLMNLIGSSAENIVERPKETAIAAATIWAAINYVPHMVKYGTNTIKKIANRNTKKA